MCSARLLRTAIAATVLATALAPLGSSAQVPQRCAGESTRTRKDGWVQLRRPAWSLGDQVVRGWAASVFVDGFLLVTNGAAVARSRDGGCTWQEVYTPDVGVGELRLESFGTVYGVALPPSPPGRLGYPAYAVVGDVRSTRVVVSYDFGESWTEQPSAGLPPLARLHSVHVAADPRTAFVLADSRSTASSVVETTLYVTRDSGLTFTPVHRGLVPNQYTQLALDPVDPRNVWAWDPQALYRSADGGLTFAEVDVPGTVNAVDVAHYPTSEPARVTVFRGDRALAGRSTDGGVTWQTVPTRGRVTGVANLYYIDAIATTSDTGVFVDATLYKIFGRDVTPHELVLDDVAWQYGDTSVNLYGNTAGDLYVIRLTPQFQPPPPPGKLPPMKLKHTPATQGVATLEPENAVVRLAPGETRVVPYELDLPPVPTPLDIFFATDSTSSMSPVIDSLRSDLQDIIDDLAKSGINVWFGVGDFKDYPGFGWPSDHPYKRFRAVGPIDSDLTRAINEISIGGGNGLDSALTATYQAATGEGQRRVGVADGGGWWVRPGNGAEWREKSLKVLVIAADVRTRAPETDPGYPGPTFKETIDKLNLLGIEHVGLAVGNRPQQPFQSLSRVSEGTGTVAPPGGTDCDDDGKVDIEAGDPLVCMLPLNTAVRSGTNLAPAMVGLMRSLEDLQPVAFSIDGDRRVADVSGPTFADAVNVKAHNVLSFAVEARCDVETAGTTYRYAVAATVSTRTVAATALTVECAALPGKAVGAPPRAAQREEIPPPSVRGLVAAAVPPPPPPPAPVTNPQVNSQPNPNPNPNPQVVAQAGMAFQDQAELQLALAHAELRVEEEVELLATSGLHDGDAARATAVLCAGLVLSAGAAVGLRRRTRAEPVRVRSSG